MMRLGDTWERAGGYSFLLHGSANACDRVPYTALPSCPLKQNKINKASSGRASRARGAKRGPAWPAGVLPSQHCLTWVTADRVEQVARTTARTTPSLHFISDPSLDAQILKRLVCPHLPLASGLYQCRAYYSESPGLLYQRHLASQEASRRLAI